VYTAKRPTTDNDWQLDVDERIRYGLHRAIELKIIEPNATIIAVQGWRAGGHAVRLRLRLVCETNACCRPTRSASCRTTASSSEVFLVGRRALFRLHSYRLDHARLRY
jgi:hypothetical protein